MDHQFQQNLVNAHIGRVLPCFPEPRGLASAVVQPNPRVALEQQELFLIEGHRVEHLVVLDGYTMGCVFEDEESHSK